MSASSICYATWVNLSWAGPPSANPVTCNYRGSRWLSWYSLLMLIGFSPAEQEADMHCKTAITFGDTHSTQCPEQCLGSRAGPDPRWMAHRLVPPWQPCKEEGVTEFLSFLQNGSSTRYCFMFLKLFCIVVVLSLSAWISEGPGPTLYLSRGCSWGISLFPPCCSLIDNLLLQFASFCNCLLPLFINIFLLLKPGRNNMSDRTDRATNGV